MSQRYLALLIFIISAAHTSFANPAGTASLPIPVVLQECPGCGSVAYPPWHYTFSVNDPNDPYDDDYITMTLTGTDGSCHLVTDVETGVVSCVKNTQCEYALNMAWQGLDQHPCTVLHFCPDADSMPPLCLPDFPCDVCDDFISCPFTNVGGNDFYTVKLNCGARRKMQLTLDAGAFTGMGLPVIFSRSIACFVCSDV